MTINDLNVFLMQYPGTSRLRLSPTDYGSLLSSFGVDQGSSDMSFQGSLGAGLPFTVPISPDPNVPSGTIQGDG